MIEIVKNKIWSLLQEKDISLAMIFNRDGEILWWRGRRIVGRDVRSGAGFSKSYINHVLDHGNTVDTQDVLIDISGDTLSDSFRALHVKSLLITRIGSNFFLYVDSGRKTSFSTEDRNHFRLLGDLLGEIIREIEISQKDTGEISGNSSITETLRKNILKCALESEPVLLLGETGTGKSHLAALIHKYSGRTGRFVVADTPTIQENLFETVMFGHKKGAFTDAKFDRKGLVAEAQNGTLFIDEISEVPLSFQAKLLRFLETKKYTVLGETLEREADIRIVAATNRDLPEAIAQKEFRSDLYYRLHILELQLQPLRRRKEDIPNLVNQYRHFLKGKTLEPTTFDVLYRHQWPGNVRELLTVLKRIGIYAGDPVTPADVDALLTHHSSLAAASLASDNDGHPVAREETMFAQLAEGKTFREIIWQPFLDRDYNRADVRRLLKAAYLRCHGNFKSMTAFLGLPPEDYHKFMALMHKYRIDPRTGSE